jgi:hypothetical protein
LLFFCVGSFAFSAFSAFAIGSFAFAFIAFSAFGAVSVFLTFAFRGAHFFFADLLVTVLVEGFQDRCAGVFNLFCGQFTVMVGVYGSHEYHSARSGTLSARAIAFSTLTLCAFSAFVFAFCAFTAFAFALASAFAGSGLVAIFAVGGGYNVHVQ